MSELTKLSVYQLSKGLEKGEFSSSEVTSAYLDEIACKDEKIGAYLTVRSERAVSEAKKYDGRTNALWGIPYAVKDNISTKGVKTTCASKILEDYVPCFDAAVIEKLKSCGSILLGKTNMDEFAMGCTTENSAFKVTRNPQNTDFVPGGSSGGSAACVAAYEAPFALGSDTGGSIRQPASFCGVVGMNPTYGAVSRYGLISFASSLDRIAPVTRNVFDSALVLSSIVGGDERDSTSITKVYDKNYTDGISGGVKNMVIGLPTELLTGEINPGVKSAILSASRTYEAMGANIREISMPLQKYALPAYYVISSAEASSNLARFDGVRYGVRSKKYTDMDSLYTSTRSEGFGNEVKRRIMLGTFALSEGYYDEYYKKALDVRNAIINEYARVFTECDVILCPVAPTAAYRIGTKHTSPVEAYLGDIYTVPSSLAGLPSLSLPCGKTADGLPIGMLLVGKALSEKLLYKAGYAFEQETEAGK